MIQLASGLESLRTNKTHRFSTCWKVERTDGVIFRFTDHNAGLMIDGELYLSMGAYDATARQNLDKLQTQNMEVKGMLTSIAITHDDLINGLYREAKIIEMLVDWKYPWAGIFFLRYYWITETTFNGESWEAKLEGITRWLQPKVGTVYARPCRYNLGDDRCSPDGEIDLDALSENGTVSDVTSAGLDNRKVFLANGLTAEDGYYDYGYLTLDGIDYEILSYTTAGILKKIVLCEPCPVKIEVDDTFVIYPGCDRMFSTCKTKFDNVINFGGFPYIPGTDRVLQTPRS